MDPPVPSEERIKAAARLSGIRSPPRAASVRVTLARRRRTAASSSCATAWKSRLSEFVSYDMNTSLGGGPSASAPSSTARCARGLRHRTNA